MSRIAGILRGSFPFARYCHHQAGQILSESKIYELRTYNIWPQHVKEFLSLTSEEFHLRTSQSKLVGYWTCELGGLNHVFHIWEYDNLEHRAHVRAKLAGDTEWIQRYFSKILPWMSFQHNIVTKVIPGISLVNTPLEKGFYQLQTLNLKGESNSVVSFKTSPILKSTNTSLLLGAFETLQGSLNEVNLLWQHSTLTAASNHVKLQNQDGQLFQYIVSGYSKILLPHKVSPLQ